MAKFLIIILSTLYFCISVVAQTTFQKILGKSSFYIDDWGCTVLPQAKDSSFIIANSYVVLDSTLMNGINILKLNKYGQTIIDTSYNVNMGDPFVYCTGSHLLQNNDILIKSISKGNNLQKRDFSLMLFSETGNLDTTYCYSGLNKQNDVALSVCYTANKEYVLTGFSEDYNRGDIYVVKTDLLGLKQWAKYYGKGGNYFERSRMIMEDADGGFILSCFSALKAYPGAELTDQDGFIMKISADGDSLWSKWYATPNDVDDCDTYVIPSQYGGYIVWGCAATANWDDWTRIYFIERLDVDGETIWHTAVNNIDTLKYIYALKELPNGEIVVAGKEFTSPDGFGEGRRGWIAKYSAAGTEIWDRVYETNGNLNESEDSYFNDIALTPDGGFIAVGTTKLYIIDTPTNYYDNQVWVLKVDALGCYEPGCSGELQFVSATQGLPDTAAALFFTIYPNPASQNTTLTCTLNNNNTTGKLLIYNILGKLVQQYPINSNPTTFTLQLPNGLYLAQYVINNVTVQQSKLMIIH